MQTGPASPSAALSSAAYGAGVVAGLTGYAALLVFVFDSAGHGLGKLNSFWWVLLINLVAAVIPTLGFRIGLAFSPADGRATRLLRPPGALLLGILFVGSVYLVRPLLMRFHAGLVPAIVYSGVGSLLLALVVARVASAARHRASR